MIRVEALLNEKFPLNGKAPSLLRNLGTTLLRRMMHEEQINAFLAANSELVGFEFIDAVLDYFDADYSTLAGEFENIPSSGRAVLIANHPLGALDALLLLKMVGSVRKDIKIVANDLLAHFSGLKPLLITVDTLGERISKSDYKAMFEALDNEELLILFPAGEVSRYTPRGVTDGPWRKGFVNLAVKKQAPIIPVALNARNSWLFYAASLINKNAAALLLPHEMFKQHGITIEMRIGKRIPAQNLQHRSITNKALLKLLKKHLYRIQKGRRGIFITEKSIAHPEERTAIKKALEASELLGRTHDGKSIYLYRYSSDSIVLKELGRLREESFRKVGEGSGNRRDSDSYDRYYDHIILWDESELEIVGSYRIGNGKAILQERGKTGLYTAGFFDFDDAFTPYIEEGIELGRSFVQPKYWGSRALDYLWQGIGAYLYNNPQIRYMFGPVSISERYPKAAQDRIVYFYSKYFGKDGLAFSKNRYSYTKNELNTLLNAYLSSDIKADFRLLKEQLSHFDVTVPTLYKHYTDLCESEGIAFLDFTVDSDFHTVDGMILVDTQKIKATKRRRYIDMHAHKEESAA